MTQRMVERAFKAELTAHLGYDPHERGEEPRGNARNGAHTKTVLGDAGAMEIEVPRDRTGSFDPQLIKKRQRRLAGFSEAEGALDDFARTWDAKYPAIARAFAPTGQLTDNSTIGLVRNLQ